MSTEVLESLVHTHYPAAVRGDRDAYGRIVAGCQSTVTSIALAIVRDVPTSEDIAQEAFLSAWQNLRKLTNPASFLPWLRQITRNLARDHLRSQGQRRAPAGDIEAVLAAVADPKPGPSEKLAHAQEQAIAADVIDCIPEESREVLLLYYREGQSSRQVASLLGLQDAAVRKRLSRARQLVREALLQRLCEFARTTAPASAFTALVVSTLTVASPPVAAAGAFGIGALSAAKGVAKIGVAAMGAAAIGIFSGLLGIWLGVRALLRNPFDVREKRDVLRYAFVSSAIVVAFSVGIVMLAPVPGWMPHLALCLAFMAAIAWNSAVWLPRIMARRRARQRSNDPERAALDDAFARRYGRLGLWLGIGLGTAGMVAGFYFSGRMG